MTNDIFKELGDSVLDGRHKDAERLAEEALHRGIPPLDANRQHRLGHCAIGSLLRLARFLQRIQLGLHRALARLRSYS